MRVFNLIVLGPQGSGKGTQAELLAKEFGYVVLGAGDLLREVAKTGTPLGREVHETINVRGQLVRPEIISEVFEAKIKSLPKDQPIIMESYPRSLEQYELMKKFWSATGRGNYQVVFIELSPEEAVNRLSKRRICENCGENYIAGEIEKCRKCGGRLIQRDDDRPEAIKERLAWFSSKVMPLVAEFEREGLVIRVDGAPAIEEVHKQIVTKLGLSS